MILAALAAMKSKANKSNDPGGGGASADLNGDGVITPKEKKVAAKRAKEAREKRNQQIAAVSDDLIQDEAEQIILREAALKDLEMPRTVYDGRSGKTG